MTVPFFRSRIALGIILAVGLLLRLYQLGSVPFGVTHDELGYIENSYSIARTGRDLLGAPYPLLTFLYGKGFPFMPVTTYLSVLVFKVLPLSAFAGRLPNAILGTISIYLIYLLANLLFKKERVALLAAAVLAVSPWHIFWDRTAYDILVAAFFYLLGTVLYLHALSHKKTPWLCALSFLLALFSYRGMSPVAVPLMALLLWYGRRTAKLPVKQIFTYGAYFAVAAACFALLALAYNNRGFLSETKVDMAKVAWDIELMRRDARGPEKFKQVFINKPMYFLNKYIPNYLQAFSVGHLFLHGEGCQTCTISNRGKLYLVDLFFVLLGLYYLLHNKQEKGSYGFVFGLLGVAALPGAVVGEPYASRAILMSIAFSLIIAVGIDGALSIRRWGKIIALVAIVMYGYSISHFLFDYYERYAYQQSSVWVADMKEVTSMISNRTDTKRSVAITGTSLVDMLQYAFYKKLDPTLVQSASTHGSTGTVRYSIDNVLFTSGCSQYKTVKEFVGKNDIGMVFGRPDCFKTDTPSQKISDFYGNPIWNVYILK